MNSTRKLLRFAALLATMMVWAGMAAAGPRAPDQTANRVTELAVEETESATLLHIGVSAEPTFSVFKLRNPSRLLVEVNDCSADEVATLAVRNGVVDAATVSTWSDDGTQRCRVIVTLDTDAGYDVDATGDAIIISVDGEGRRVGEASADPKLASALADREAELERTRGALEKASAELDGLRQERERATARVSELEGRQAELDAQLASGQGSQKALDEARTELARLERDLAAQREAAQSLGTRADTQSERVAALSGQIDALKVERDEALARISELATERDHASRRAEAAETRASELQSEVERLDQALARSEKDGARAGKLGEELQGAEARQSELEARLAELQGQVASGSAEAEKQLAEAERAVLESTREATRVREQLEQLKKATSTESSALKAELEARQSELSEARARADALRAASEAKVAELGEALAERDAELVRREGELTELRTAEAKLRDELARAREGAESGGADAVRMQDEINALKRRQAKLTTEMEQEVGALQQTLAEREAALGRAQERETELLGKYESLKQEREKEQVAVTALISDKEARLGQAKETEAALREELAALRSELEVRSDDPLLATAVAEAEGKLEKAVGRQTALQSEVDALARRLEENQAEVERVRGQAESASKAAREREGELQAEIARLDGLAGRAQQQLAEAQARELELQAEVARLSAELDEAASHNNEREAALQAEIERLRGQVDVDQAARSEIERLRAEVEAGKSARTQLEQLQAQSAQSAEAQAARDAELERLRRTVAELETNQGALEEAERAARDAESARAEQVRLQGEIDALRGQVEQADAAKAELRKLRTQAQDSDEARAELARLKQQVSDAEAARTELTKLRTALADAESAQLELERTRAALSEAQSASVELEQARAELARLEQAQGELVSLRAKVARAEAAESELAGLREAAAQLEKTESELAQLQSELEQAQRERRSAEQSRDAQIAKLQAELEATREAAAAGEAHESQIAKLQQELETARREASQGEARDAEIAKLQVELETAREEAAAGEARDAEIAKLQAELESARRAAAQGEARDAEIAKLQRELESAREAAAAGEAHEAQIAKLQAELEAARAAPAPAAVVATAGKKDAAAAPLDTSVAASGPKRVRKGSKAGAAVGVKDIRFEKSGSTSRVVVELDGAASYHTVPWKNGTATLVLEGAGLPEALERKLDTRAFRGPVQFVSSFVEGGDVQLVAQIDGAGSEVVRVDGDTLIWEFAEAAGGSGVASDAGGGESTFVDRRKHVRINAQQPVDTTGGAVDDDDITVRFGRRETLTRGRLARRRLTLDVRDADINDILRLIADEVGVSIVTSPDVQGTVTLSLKSVPLDQALDIILRSQDLAMRQEGNIIWVAQASVFREEQARELEAALVRERLERLEVRLIPVNYSTAAELQDNVAALLSERGAVQIDERTNTLIVKDVQDNLNAVEVLVESLDTQTPQILIEARIVETQSNYTQEIGVQWGGDFSFSPANGNPTGLVFPSTIGVAGGSTADQNTGTSANPNFAVNLPAAVGTGSGGALGMTFGSIGGAVNLNLRLSALEEKGFVKIVSAPRVMTLDNVEASIEQGVSIPVSVVSAAGVQTVFFDAKLNLQVTPHVTRDGNIFLVIDVTKNEPDFANTGAQGDPSIIRKEAHTQLLVPDGDTTVIGGIYTRNAAQGVSSVPFFGDIPFLGYFFRKTTETDNRTELLIFITPRIINREASIGVVGPGSFMAPEPEDE